MEPAAAWGPCELQLANWAVEEPANDGVWAPAAGLPVEYYASIDVFDGTWSLQSYVPTSDSSRGQQLVEYNCYAATTQQQDDPLQVFEKAASKFVDGMTITRTKIHRYPPSINDLGDWYTIPRVVAIGPYHHRRRKLNHVEGVKHAAAYHCIANSGGHSPEEMYHAVIKTVAKIKARDLYDEDAMEGFSDDEFLPMMFFDACFLVMYMLKWSGEDCDRKLYDFFESNGNDIDHDVMLLENQIPWPVVDAIMQMQHTPVPLEKFIAKWNDGRLQDRVDEAPPAIVMDPDYSPPHLLGLLRSHIVGRSRGRSKVHGLEKMGSLPVSVSAVELADMGIILTANKTPTLADMGLTEMPVFFAKLSMAALSLNDLRASMLVNMAALELCTTLDFFDKGAEDADSAVCSYLRLLCMLVHREEDVHQLRAKGVLQGGAGLSNNTALHFFTGLQSLRLGRCCGRVMVQIESYRMRRSMLITVFAFLRNYWKTIVGVGSAIGAFFSIYRAIKGAH